MASEEKEPSPQERNAKHTLVAICIAAVWILVLHGAIVVWAMFEPSRVERIEERLLVEDKTATASAKVDSEAVAQGGSASTESMHTNPAAALGRSAHTSPRTLGWSHVAFPAVLLGSCVAIFASLAWAAVALNREYD